MEPYVCFDQHPLYQRTISVRNSRSSLAVFELPQSTESLYFTYYDVQVNVDVTRLGKLLNIDVRLDLPHDCWKSGYISLWIGGDLSRGPTHYCSLRDGRLGWRGLVPKSERMGIYIAL